MCLKRCVTLTAAHSLTDLDRHVCAVSGFLRDVYALKSEVRIHDESRNHEGHLAVSIKRTDKVNPGKSHDPVWNIYYTKGYGTKQAWTI